MFHLLLHILGGTKLRRVRLPNFGLGGDIKDLRALDLVRHDNSYDDLASWILSQSLGIWARITVSRVWPRHAIDRYCFAENDADQILGALLPACKVKHVRPH